MVKQMEKPRHVTSPYSYHGDSSKPRSWSVWDTVNGEWTGDYVGGKQGAEEAAETLNYKYYECPACGFVQVDTATVEEITCDRCDNMYSPA